MPGNTNFPGVYIEEVPSGGRPIAGVPTAVTAFVGATRRGPVNRPVQIFNYPEFERVFGVLAPHLDTSYAVWQFFLNGGKEAWVVRVRLKPTRGQLQKGWLALDQVDLFNLLVLPGVSVPDTLVLAAGYCAKRRAMLIADAPPALTPGQAAQAVGAFGAGGDRLRNVALYYPWIRIDDPTDSKHPRLSPPSGTVAGLYARTDANRGVWKAPAGVEADLRGCKGLEYDLTDGDNGLLNPLGLNCLRVLSAGRTVAWGARTLRGSEVLADEYKYVPVRRLALFLEESIARGLSWVVFEPNAEPLWAQIRLNVGAFMHTLWRQGAFQGRTPKDSYFVKCDRETTTADDINHGIVNVMVGFAPLKPAEFVIIRLQQLAGPAGV